jgi:hypothetical protein
VLPPIEREQNESVWVKNIQEKCVVRVASYGGMTFRINTSDRVPSSESPQPHAAPVVAQALYMPDTHLNQPTLSSTSAGSE